MSVGISCSELLTSKVKMDAMWRDAQANADYIAEVETLKVLKGNQRGMSFPDLEDKTKDKTVKVMWLTDCSPNDVTDCTTECTIAGNEIDDDCQDYTLDICKQIEFKVPEKRWRTSMWSKEEVLAKTMMTNMKVLDEGICNAVIALLDTYTGTNAYTGPYSMVGTDTSIPAANWNPNLFSYLMESAILNRMRDAYLLSGHNLFQQNWNAAMEAANAQNGAANAAKINSIQKYFDLFNLDSTLGAKKSFLIRPSATAFVSKNYWPSVPEPLPGATNGSVRYSMQSFNLPFITYDVIMVTECVNNEYFYKFRLSFKGGFFQNPVNCDGTKTGVLSFVCA